MGFGRICNRIGSHFLIILIITLIFWSNVRAMDFNLEINGQPISNPEGIYLISGRSMVPVKTLARTLGLSAIWYESTKIIRIDDISQTLYLKIGEPVIRVNNKAIPLEFPPIIKNGQTFVPLRSIAEVLQIDVKWYPDKKLIILKRNTLTNVSIETYSDRARVIFDITEPQKHKITTAQNPERFIVEFTDVIDGFKKKFLSVNHQALTAIKISQPGKKIIRAVMNLPDSNIAYETYVFKEEGKLVIDLFLSSNDLQRPLSLSEENILRNKNIVIDPGHGGDNPGALGVLGTYESDINYDIALRLKNILKQTGARIFLTRDVDEDPGLYERAKFANKNKADIFISIHADAHLRPEIRGTTMYAHYNASKENWSLAWYVHDEIVKATGLFSRGLKAADFVVLRETKSLSLLVESAYLSNKEDEKLLKNPAFRQRVALGIFKGLIRYYRSGVFDNTT